MDPNTKPTPTQSSPPNAPQNTTAQKQTLLYLAGAVVLLIVIISGIYFLFSYFTRESNQNQTAQTTQTGIDDAPDDSALIPTTSGPQTYVSQTQGWSITYPQGMYVIQVQTNPTERGENILEIVDFSSQAPGTPAPQNSSGNLNFSIHTLETSGQNLEDLARSISSEENATYQLGGATVTPITVNGTQGYRVVMEGNSEVSGWTDIYLPGKDAQSAVRVRYSYTGDNYKTIAEEMVSSFKTN